MFSQVCVKNSVHRGPGGCLPGGCLPGGGCPGPGPRVCVSQHALRQTPPQQTATAADGTHPTGMHSCSFLYEQMPVIFESRNPISSR